MAKKAKKAKANLPEIMTEEQVLCLAAFHVSVTSGDLSQKLLALVDDDDDSMDYAVELSTEYFDISARLWELAWEFKKIVTGVGDPYEQKEDQ